MPRDITRAQPPEPTLGFIPSCPPFLGLGRGERLRSSSWGERDRLPPPGPAAVRVAFLFSHGSLGAEHELPAAAPRGRGRGGSVAHESELSGTWHPEGAALTQYILGEPPPARASPGWAEAPPLAHPRSLL